MSLIKGKTVIIAMSGGVDSSTVAALLHENGNNVIGVTLQMHKGCYIKQHIEDAQEVAIKLGIQHYILNCENRFKKLIIDDFVEKYISGETPSPCVKCNSVIKFEELFKIAKGLNADAIATGHYIRKVCIDNSNELHIAFDKRKDQSYFLFDILKDQIKNLHFPLGYFTKEQTRLHAERLGLKTAKKKESQNICFLSGVDYKEFILESKLGAELKGPILHTDGYKIGEHNGIINYTIGQRRGLKISNKDPLYVIQIDAIKNIVYVGPKNALYKQEFIVEDYNWLGQKDELYSGLSIWVKIRSTHIGVSAKLYPLDSNRIKVILLEAQRAVTPGQACAFYKDSRLLGGGWINK